MRKKVIFISSIIVVSACFLICFSAFFPKVKEEITVGNMGEMSLKDIFDKEGRFYVYFYKNNCLYCENIDNDIVHFAENNIVYSVNIDNTTDEMEIYDWMKHKEQFDIEIGKKEKDTLVLYNDLNREAILIKFPAMYYMVKLADKTYAERYKGKEEDKIYAVSTHPILLDKDFNVDHFVMPGVPMLVEFDNHKVINYYFDDKEIIDFLHSDTIAIDSYWNLE